MFAKGFSYVLMGTLRVKMRFSFLKNVNKYFCFECKQIFFVIFSNPLTYTLEAFTTFTYNR